MDGVPRPASVDPAKVAERAATTRGDPIAAKEAPARMPPPTERIVARPIAVSVAPPKVIARVPVRPMDGIAPGVACPSKVARAGSLPTSTRVQALPPITTMSPGFGVRDVSVAASIINRRSLDGMSSTPR